MHIAAQRPDFDPRRFALVGTEVAGLLINEFGKQPGMIDRRGAYMGACGRFVVYSIVGTGDIPPADLLAGVTSDCVGEEGIWTPSEVGYVVVGFYGYVRRVGALLLAYGMRHLTLPAVLDFADDAQMNGDLRICCEALDRRLLELDDAPDLTAVGCE